MLRASSLTAVTRRTWSVWLKPISMASSRTRARTLTRSSLPEIERRSASGCCMIIRAHCSSTILLSHPLFQDSQPVVNVERRGHPLKLKAELDERYCDGGLDAY